MNLENSQRSGAGWTLLLVVSAALAGYWIFGQADARNFFNTFHSFEPDTALALRIPLILLCVSTVLAMALRENLRDVRFLRVVLLALPLLVLVKAFYLGAGFARNVMLVLPGIAILLASVALGLFALRRLKLDEADFLSSIEQTALAAPLGAGMLALALFGLGSFGALNVWLWRAVVLLSILAGAGGLRELGRRMADDARYARENHCRITRAALIFSGLWVAAHITLLWSPPLEYDVLEYHLAAPAQYLRQGQIAFLHENIYATFPQNGEMLFLLALLTAGDKLAGLPAAHLILLGFWTLSLFSVYALASRVLRRDKSNSHAPAALAVLLFALVPMNSSLFADFYVEHIQTGFHLAAVLAATMFLVSSNNRLLVLAGILAGLTCGSKYTALLFTLAPLLICTPLFALLEHNVATAARALALLGVPAALAFSPWLLRNGLVAGDPIYPLGLVLARRVGSSAAAADRIDHFDLAHRSGAISFKAFGRSLLQLFPRLTTREGWLTSAECGPHLLAFVPMIFSGLRRKEAAFLFCIVLLELLFWFLFSHRLNRFFHGALPLLAVLAAAGIAALWQYRLPRIATAAIVAAAILILAPLPMVVVWKFSRPEVVSGQETIADAARAQYRQHGNGAWYHAWESVNNLPTGSRALFIGDAQTFYLSTTPAYSVVFNPSLLETALQQAKTGGDVKAFLKERGITHLYINYPEWFRLDTSYAVAQSNDKVTRAQFTPKAREELANAIGKGAIKAYFQTWPASIAHAYLKADAQSAAVLEDFLNKETRLESRLSRNERLTIELRRIK